ncbi:MAG: GNAT family N-acetyltransferase [Chlorobiaceae bacterium]|nr:GNAT family N-acetyltransferase [Chlorobiaceae bacterium]
MEHLSGYTIRIMSRKEIDLAIEWGAEENWNPGLEDADCFYMADPEGFLVGRLNGEAVACLSVVRYGENFGFLGFYIVKPEHRGKGLGLRIWNAGMKRLEGRTVGLDGVITQQENYKKSGFTFAHRNIRYMGLSSKCHDPHPDIIQLAKLPCNEVLAFDRKFFPSDRQDFMRCWMCRKGSLAFGFRRNGRLEGYGLIRPCYQGFKIGPLFAWCPESAEKLFNVMSGSVPEGSPIYLDTPGVNPAALELAQRHRMKAVFETARMYKGDAPELPLEQIYGVTSFELG